jgi:GDPmannose 4,6-dehydratase
VSGRVPRALITGIAGQDGSYLAELLTGEGVEVHGVLREGDGAANLEAVRDAVTLHRADLLAPGALGAIVLETAPDEIYHLAAPSFVPRSWSALAETVRAIVAPAAELLDAVRAQAPRTRVVIASSREIFGAGAPSPQREDTPCRPTNPYGVAKLAAHQLARLAREHHGLHVSSAILFNHESVRRPPEFVTRKVTAAAAAISLGRERRLQLGDLDAVRDWSAAVDVVRGLRLMAAAQEGGDYILASGVGRTVRELVAVAFACVGLDAEAHVEVNPALVRPPEPSPPVGDATRARERLRWEPQVSFEQLVAAMVAADVETLRDRDL